MGKRDAAAVSADRLGAEFESFRRMTDDVYWKVQQRAKAGASQRSMFMMDGNNLVHRRPGGQGGGNPGGNTGGPPPTTLSTLHILGGGGLRTVAGGFFSPRHWTSRSPTSFGCRPQRCSAATDSHTAT